MVALLWETVLILLVAYFLGAFLGCMLRRLFAGPPKEAPVRAGAAVAAAGGGLAAAAGAESERFERALTGESVARSDTVAAPAPTRPPPEPRPAENAAEDVAENTVAPADVASQIEQISPTLRSTPLEPLPPETAPLPTETEIAPPPAPEPTAPAPRTEDRSPVSTATVAAAGATIAAAGAAIAASDTSTETPPVAAAAVATAPDDLLDIRGLDADSARRLNEAGVTSWAQIADWNAEDVSGADEGLGLNGRVMRGNWVEQASLLARGSTTRFAARRRAG
ncbi:MAG: hypothetical protein AAFY64_04050, partial [Pseudomonadota bacterium]